MRWDVWHVVREKKFWISEWRGYHPLWWYGARVPPLADIVGIQILILK